MATTSAMPQIETIVMLMLENRSLDTVLGWLYRDSAPNSVYPPGSNPKFDGIPAGVSNAYNGKSYAPAMGTQQMSQPCRVPRWDPNEDFEHVKVQLYADGSGNLPANPWPSPPPMTGFVDDFDAFYTTNVEVMGAYDVDQLPVLYGLASNFAVSDRWFASVPTQTNANRAFSICGTSLGGVDNGTPDVFDAPTLFNVLSGHKSWGIYWQYDGLGSGDPTFGGPCYTVDIFPQIKQAVSNGQGKVDTQANFLAALAAGDDIPAFCYLEPFWGGGKGWPTGQDFVGLQGNDYHPPAWIGPAEQNLNVVYNALRASKQWPNMLWIITFDEHGGTWDHVSPPLTVAPDGDTTTFDFTRLGVRVPMILVSPYVAPGSVFRAGPESSYDFDHTSVIATTLRWAGIDPATAGLGGRVAVAPSFEEVLSPSRFDNSPSFVVPPSYASQGGGLGPHLLDFDLAGVPIQDFRQAVEQSSSVEEVTAKLRSIAEDRTGGLTPTSPPVK